MNLISKLGVLTQTNYDSGSLGGLNASAGDGAAGPVVEEDGSG